MDKNHLKVVLLASEDWIPDMSIFTKGDRPDPVILYQILADQYGIDIEVIDPILPRNLPLLRRHTAYRGIDPIRAIKVLLTRRKADIVISVFESSILIMSLFRHFFSYKPKLVIWDLVPDEVWRTRRFLQNIAVPRVDHLLLLSGNQIPYLHKRWGVDARAKIVWQHVDTEFYRPQAPNPDGPILAIGDDHGRDWPTLLEALAPLDIDVIIKTKSKLNVPSGSRVRLKQISDRVSFQELRELYAKASFVVIPLSETLNVSGVGSVLESMAMGKALIISDNPPIRDYLDPGQTADVVPVGDSAKLRQAVLALKDNPERMQSMGNLARARAVRLYGFDAYAKRFADTLHALSGSNHSSA